MSKKSLLVQTAIAFSLSTFSAGFFAPLAYAQTDEALDLAPNSPFQDPDIIYLDADELINDTENGLLTASGEVEGRYQDKTLRADVVKYYLETGQVIALGNVVLVNANGTTQYAEKLELSGELEAGTAVNFTARFPEGGQLAAAFAKRNSKDGVELYNAYYTACEACSDAEGKGKKPTWRIKARRVSQNKKTKSISYRDAVFEFKGIPILYTPYLAHPDPSAGRQSGVLTPFFGVSGNKGFNALIPYYVALSPYSELTLTPRIYQKVNPLLEAQYRRKFYSGEFNLNGSITYSSFFDRDGKNLDDQTVFVNPDDSVASTKWRSSFYTNGLFHLNDTWKAGFEAGYATDDNYLDRYDIDDPTPAFGLYRADYRRLTQQAFIVGQTEDYRLSVSSFANVSLRTRIIEQDMIDPITGAVVRDPVTGDTILDPNRLRVFREDDSILPVVLPKIELNAYFDDPLLNGRIKVFGDTTVLSRQRSINSATDYTRASGGVNWSKNWITPMGVEIKPFANTRFDYFKFNAQDQDSTDFSRAVGQVGADIRWPFIKTGESVDWILEPRVQITQSFGDGKLGNFVQQNANGQTVSLIQDGLDIDLDRGLLWNSNKGSGFDVWQDGFRADVGGAVSANWGTKNYASLFLGQSYYSGDQAAYGITTGLSENRSDLVGELDLRLGKRFRSKTRVRFDEDEGAFRRLDTSLNYKDKRFNARLRYFKLDAAATPLAVPGITDIPPSEELSGYIGTKIIDNWSTGYKFNYDIDRNEARRQTFSLIYHDNCTRIEFMYNKSTNGLGIIGNSQGFGVRVSLLTLGDFVPE